MSSQTPTILVTGASGQLGPLVIEELLARGVPASTVRAGARSPQKLSDLSAAGVTAVALDYTSPETIATALDGVDTLVLISSSEVGQRAQQHQNVLDAAVAAGVTKLVYTSLTEAQTSSSPLAPEHKITEDAIKRSGLTSVIVRNNWYTENYEDDAARAAESGELTASAGTGSVASASRADYAAGIAAVALDDQYNDQVLEFGGDVAWTYDQLARTLGELAGREVTYRALTTEDHAQLLSSFGLDESTASFVTALDASIAEGALSFTDGTLSRIIGRPTTPVKDTLRASVTHNS